MLADLDLLLIYVFCIADDLLPKRPANARRSLTDAEVVTLCVAQSIMGITSDQRFARTAVKRLGHLFPALTKRSGLYKRRDRLADTIEALIATFASQSPGWHDDLLLVDSTPVECARSRETVKRAGASSLGGAIADAADYGYCASHTRARASRPRAWRAQPPMSSLRTQTRRANLVRALVVLSANVPQPVLAAFGDDVLRVAGHGLPRAARATASAGPRAVLIGEFSMATDTVAIHPLPVPKAFHDGRAARSIRVALAFDPPVRRTRREYLAGAMSFDLLRATDLDEVAAIYRKQDEDDPLSLPSDRRRMKLLPGSQTFDNSTLMVRGIRTVAPLSEDDGDTYFLAVTHNNRPWARQGKQRYAVAVETRGARPPRRRPLRPARRARPTTRAHPPPLGGLAARIN